MTKKELKEEEVKNIFMNIIREKMSDKEFWDWVSEWYDSESIIDIAENWDVEEMQEVIEEYYKKHPEN